MGTIKMGLTVSCGRNSGMDQDATLHLSPQFPGDGKPHDVDVQVKKGDDARTIAEKITDALNRVAKGHGDSAGGPSSASSKSRTEATGSKATGSGKMAPTSTIVCLVTVTNIESMDVGTDDKKIRFFSIGTGTPTPPGTERPGGGLKPKGSIDVTKIDCEAYREKLRKDPSEKQPGTVKDWFCNPDKGIAMIAAVGGMPHIAVALVGADGLEGAEEPFAAPLGASRLLQVPFRVIPGSIELQVFEIQMRLAASGVVTEDRSDGIVVPLRIIAGPLEGEAVKSFGIMTPYDPLGYNAFPWTVVVGDSASVASHCSGSAGALNGLPRYAAMVPPPSVVGRVVQDFVRPLTPREFTERMSVDEPVVRKPMPMIASQIDSGGGH